MRILLLGPERHHITAYLQTGGDTVITTAEQINGQSAILDDVDFLISYGYRFIVGKDVLTKFPAKAINLHISYLPWNRGADPNVWSFLEDTPKGVTIHHMDEGLDTGPIIARRLIEYSVADTLKTTYGKLSTTIETLFMEKWPDIRNGSLPPFYPSEQGSYHSTKDRHRFEHLLTKGWDTPVTELIGKATKRGDFS